MGPTLLSPHQFILEKGAAIPAEYFHFARVTQETEDFWQFEVDPYRIWNAAWHGFHPQGEIETLFTGQELLKPFLDRVREETERAVLLIEGHLHLRPPQKVPYRELPSLSLMRTPRPDQAQALSRLMKEGRAHSGIVQLPGGRGKTGVGLLLQLCLQQVTWILSPSESINHQWKREWRAWMGKEPIPWKTLTFPEFKKQKKSTPPFLIILDEVHRVSTEILQWLETFSGVVLGLSATCDFNSDRSNRVFQSIGPLLYEERRLTAEFPLHFTEYLLPLEGGERRAYFSAQHPNQRFQIAAKNSLKIPLALDIYRKRPEKRTLFMGEYLEPLKKIQSELNIPLLSGQSDHERRQSVYRQFNEGDIRAFISTSVSNEGIDLPQADCLIQLSIHPHRRADEFQRLGRILRNPEQKKAEFFSLVTQGSAEESQSLKNKEFLSRMGLSWERKYWVKSLGGNFLP